MIPGLAMLRGYQRLVGKIGTELLFPTLPAAVRAYQDGTKDPAAGNQGP